MHFVTPTLMFFDDTNPSKLRKKPHFKDPLGFSNRVPIFDGHASNLLAFQCLPWQLSQIGQQTYPQYLASQHDLPNDSVVTFVVLLALPPSPTNSAPLMPASSIAGPSKPSSSDPPSGLSFPSSSHSSKSLASLSSPFDENGELQEDCEWFDLSHP
ncbi:hypothetical protein BT96DRAFT_1007938 [Gymnopus androsaceus JB14]|uniref:Uncharacterized protein n=1 Tax=Gymnopus androsaceus JB14 TaxID=1447944 RepID=A0A6A4GG51_9AGAR|nr:hypothetical protein BT96DRAFT_1007938 [Gymnopus androsaceus JB14]